MSAKLLDKHKVILQDAMKMLVDSHSFQHSPEYSKETKELIYQFANSPEYFEGLVLVVEYLGCMVPPFGELMIRHIKASSRVLDIIQLMQDIMERKEEE